MQRSQGETHGGYQVEGCYVSQIQQGEGRVTPVPTASHAVHAKLYRHVLLEYNFFTYQQLQLQGDVQGDVQGEGEASLVKINPAFAATRLIFPSMHFCTLNHNNSFVYFCI